MSDVEVEPDGIRVVARDGETVLSALFRAGYGYRVGCRRGGCGMCKVDLVQGEVEYRAVVADTVLSADERHTGTCLTCRAVPQGDVSIRLRDERIRVVLPILYALVSDHPSDPDPTTARRRR